MTDLEFYKTRLEEMGRFITEQLHPEYGPCDGLAEGQCSVCLEVLGRLKEAFEKLRGWTDPDASESAPVGECVSCRLPETYVYHVPESFWRKIVPEKWRNEIVCAGCFHGMAMRLEAAGR